MSDQPGGLLGALARYDAEENHKDPGRRARIAALRETQRQQRDRRRAEIITRYGSEEAAIAGPPMQQRLVAAAAPYTTKVPYEFLNGIQDTDAICGWTGILFEKPNEAAVHLFAAAHPMPATLADARAEYDLWMERDEELNVLLCLDGFAADSYLPLACRGRKAIVEGLLDTGIRARTVAEALVRLRWIMNVGEICNATGEALVHDLECLAAETPA